MTRRRRRYRGEGEEGTWVKIGVGIGFLCVLAIVIGVGWVYFSKKQAAASVDPQTFCPKDGPTSVTSVLIDRTDGINQVQAEALKNLIVTWVHEVPEHGAFRVYEVAGGSGFPAPVLSVCNPGNVEDVNVFTGNERLTKQRYEAKFMGPVEQLISGMLTDKAAETSPIMEAVQAMAIRDFGSGKVSDGKLIIVSDFLQHTAEFSLYKQPPDVSAFRRTVYGQKVESNLHGVSAQVAILHSTSPKQSSEIIQFWLDWLLLQGAVTQPPLKVPG
jgi:hypothetical protein